MIFFEVADIDDMIPKIDTKILNHDLDICGFGFGITMSPNNCLVSSFYYS